MWVDPEPVPPWEWRKSKAKGEIITQSWWVHVAVVSPDDSHPQAVFVFGVMASFPLDMAVMLAHD